LFVTCQVDEDLPYIVQFAGEDNLITGSDFTHADPATEPEYLSRFRERVDRGEISETLVRKMTQDNPKEFYGLSPRSQIFIRNDATGPAPRERSDCFEGVIAPNVDDIVLLGVAD